MRPSKGVICREDSEAYKKYKSDLQVQGVMLAI